MPKPLSSRRLAEVDALLRSGLSGHYIAKKFTLANSTVTRRRRELEAAGTLNDKGKVTIHTVTTKPWTGDSFK